MPKNKLPDKNFEWTPNLAYVVGLLTTDGCLSNDGRHIVMRSAELTMLRTFKSCLGLSNRIGKTYSEKRTHYRVQFCNIQFYRWLINIGLFPKKTYTIGEIKVPDRYFRDFLRGHLDGDGSITIYRDSYNARVTGNTKYVYMRLSTRFISASHNHINWLQANIHRLFGVHGAIHEGKPLNNNRVSMWVLKFMKGDSLKLLPILYYKNNLPCLERKRRVVEDFQTKTAKEPVKNIGSNHILLKAEKKILRFLPRSGTLNLDASAENLLI